MVLIHILKQRDGLESLSGRERGESQLMCCCNAATLVTFVCDPAFVQVWWESGALQSKGESWRSPVIQWRIEALSSLGLVVAGKGKARVAFSLQEIIKGPIKPPECKSSNKQKLETTLNWPSDQHFLTLCTPVLRPKRLSSSSFDYFISSVVFFFFLSSEHLRNIHLTLSTLCLNSNKNLKKWAI